MHVLYILNYECINAGDMSDDESSEEEFHVLVTVTKYIKKPFLKRLCYLIGLVCLELLEEDI